MKLDIGFSTVYGKYIYNTPKNVHKICEQPLFVGPVFIRRKSIPQDYEHYEG